MESQDKMPSVELILDYLDKMLDKDATERLETLLSKSEKVSSMVEGIQFLYEQGQTREDIEKYAESLEGGFESKKEEVQETSSINWLKIAASVSILVLMGLAIYLTSGNKENDHLAYVDQELSTPYSAPDLFRGNDSDDQTWADAVAAYKEKDYPLAIELLITASPSKEDPTTNFYIGLSYLYQNPSQQEQAIGSLEKVASSTHILSDRAKWYLSLSYIQNNEVEKAIPLLNKLSVNGAYKSRESEELLSLLQ